MQDPLLNRISFLNQTTVESLLETDEKNIIRRFAESSVNIMGADFGFVWLNTKNARGLQNFQLVYTTPGIPYTPKIPRNNGSTQKVLKTKKPLFIENLSQSKYVRSDANPYITSIAVIPMVYKDLVYGSFYVSFKYKHAFSDEEKSLAEFIGNDAGQVLTIHRSHKKTERDSQKLLNQKDEFFNIASHELKTPVTTIKGFTQILTEKLGGSDKKTKYYLGKINNQVDKLSHLINDLLDVSRIETGKLKFERSNFELRSLVQQLVENLKVTLPFHPISFKSDYQFWMKGDGERIERVVTNLINNAARYSKPGSKIKVRLERVDGSAHIEVEDFGFGISEKDHSKIFNRFFQSKKSSKENIPGLGLGLYIASSIVKHHGGNLDFKSKSKGTIFYFSLPYYKCRKVSRPKK